MQFTSRTKSRPKLRSLKNVCPTMTMSRGAFKVKVIEAIAHKIHSHVDLIMSEGPYRKRSLHRLVTLIDIIEGTEKPIVFIDHWFPHKERVAARLVEGAERIILEELTKEELYLRRCAENFDEAFSPPERCSA